jgi:hypothetical protein
MHRPQMPVAWKPEESIKAFTVCNGVLILNKLLLAEHLLLFVPHLVPIQHTDPSQGYILNSKSLYRAGGGLLVLLR